jgi:hypothetical protein
MLLGCVNGRQQQQLWSIDGAMFAVGDREKPSRGRGKMRKNRWLAGHGHWASAEAEKKEGRVSSREVGRQEGTQEEIIQPKPMVIGHALPSLLNTFARSISHVFISDRADKVSTWARNANSGWKKNKQRKYTMYRETAYCRVNESAGLDLSAKRRARQQQQLEAE